ncbi:hypothetical protein L1887_27306 [Cichorium endivia]|nr:hypothetical protein L1887_27306 [Cichorium endivia]
MFFTCDFNKYLNIIIYTKRKTNVDLLALLLLAHMIDGPVVSVTTPINTTGSSVSFSPLICEQNHQLYPQSFI